MTDLKRMLQAHPDCLANRNRFKSFLQDVYPTEKRMVNLVVILVECGIVEKINKLSVLGEKEISSFTLQMENEYGISPQYSYDAIIQWAQALDKKIALQHPPVFCVEEKEREMPKQAPIEYTEGDSGDYVVLAKGGKYYITKFVGFEEEKMTIPSLIDGKKIYGIDVDVFKKSPIVKQVIISNGIEFIGAGAFEESQSLESVSIPKSVTKICQRAFSKCRKLESLIIPDSVTVIENNAFSYCSDLTTLRFPDTLGVIPESVCQGCNTLWRLTLPTHLHSIEKNAFESCKSIKEVHIPADTVKIEAEAFACCERLEKVYIPFATELMEGVRIGKPVHPFRGWLDYREPTRLTIVCDKGSKAMEFARKYGIKCAKA